MRRITILSTVLALFILGGCSSDEASDGFGQPSAVTPTPTEAVDPLFGTWTWQLDCEDLVQTLDEAELSEFTAEWVVGLGFHSGPASKVTKETQPCAQAGEPIQRTTEFTEAGQFIETADGEVVCDCTYDYIGPGTFVMTGDPGDPAVTVHYRAAADTVSFEVTLEEPCTDTKCRSQKAWALETFTLGDWERTSP